MAQAVAGADGEIKAGCVNCGPHIQGDAMILTTTDSVEGRKISGYLGIVAGEAVMGTNIFRDFFAGITDILGGRSGSYEKELRKAKALALESMIEEARALGADAVVGMDLDYQQIGGTDKQMLMVAASGTAVKLA
jgi:uncharacterized protein YbjQ (UPF0145 family)